MKSLPWVVQPAKARTRQIGDEVTGILELPVRGGLTVGEERLINSMLPAHHDVQKAESELYNLIATAEEITMMEARAIVQDRIKMLPQEDKAAFIADKYQAEIAGFQNESKEFGYCIMDATVTAIIQSRLKKPDWTIADTQSSDFDRKLYLALWEFAQEEINAEQQSRATEPATEESLGKHSSETIRPKRTGRRSSGN